MSNYRVIRTYRKIRRNRRRLGNIGFALFGTGFLGAVIISGESALSLGQICLWGLVFCVLMGLGGMIANFVQALEEEYPITLNLVEKGDRLCYTISTTKQKASVYND